MRHDSPIPAIAILSFIICLAACNPGLGGAPPQAPATISWLPHGYGGKMHVHNTIRYHKKGLGGFRSAPEHTGCWSQPLWGWAGSGFYVGQNRPQVDPAMCQLPIGLIYPENSPALPPPPRRIRK